MLPFLLNKITQPEKKWKQAKRKSESFPLNGAVLCSKRKDNAQKKSWKGAGDIMSKVLDMNNNEQKHSCLLFI